MLGTCKHSKQAGGLCTKEACSAESAACWCCGLAASPRLCLSAPRLPLQAELDDLLRYGARELFQEAAEVEQPAKGTQQVPAENGHAGGLGVLQLLPCAGQACQNVLKAALQGCAYLHDANPVQRQAQQAQRQKQCARCSHSAGE